MARGAVWLTLGVSAVIGVLLGVVLFTQVGPLPLGRDSAEPGPQVSSAAPEPGASTPAPSTPAPSTASSTAKPSEPTTTSSAPEPPESPDSDAPFTARALLQPADFERRGWGNTRVLQTWQGLPPDQVTTCAAPDDKGDDLSGAYAATYQGRSTTAAEIVIRYADEETAVTAWSDLVKKIEECKDQPETGEEGGGNGDNGDDDRGEGNDDDGEGDDKDNKGNDKTAELKLKAEPMEAPAPDGISDLLLWNTTGVEGTTAEGVVGLARSGDRIAFLTMLSTSTDPTETTEIGSLMLQAGRRLA